MILIIYGSIVLMFVVLGIIFSKGKGAMLISGYNTSKDKYKYDEVALCKFMGKFMFALAFSWLIVSLSEVLDNMIFHHIGFILFGIFIIFALIYMNTGNRFKK